MARTFNYIEINNGDTFGELTVKENLGRITKHKAEYYLCECSCGNNIKVRKDSLINNNKEDCGCVKRYTFLNFKGERRKLTEWSRITNIPYNTITKRLKRGWSIEEALTKPLEIQIDREDAKGIWKEIIKRCTSVNCADYKDYGKLGITICDRWLESYDNFIEDMGERPSIYHSIDRLDNTKGYYKENCRWATDEEQANNTRKNIIIEYKGKRMSLAQWARELGVKYEKLKYRYHKGLNPEEIFNFNQEDK